LFSEDLKPKTKTAMTLTKRNIVTRISGETGLTQEQVFEVVQKTLDYITEATSASLKSRSARRASAAIRDSRMPT
jgi:hypothetical protein